MAKSIRWADISDGDTLFSDEESANTMPELPSPGCQVKSDSLEGFSLPFYLKFLNFPYTAAEGEIREFLGVRNSQIEQLELLYSKERKRKFRGIALFKATNYESGYQLLEMQGKEFKGRTISVKVLTSWVKGGVLRQPKPKLIRPEDQQWRNPYCPTLRGSRKNS